MTFLNPLLLLFASLAIGCSAESGRILPIVESDSGEPDLGLGTGGTRDEGTGGMGTGGAIDTGIGVPMDVAPDLPVAQDLPSEEAPPPAAPFACNQVMGGFVLGQWYPSFESKMDSTHWQELTVTGASIEVWANMNSTIWNAGVMSSCAPGLKPDRVLMIVYSSTLTTSGQYQTSINGAISTIKTKYPNVKRIELLTTLRSPNNQLCPNNNSSLTVVPAYVDQAIQVVAAASGGMVTVGPKIAVPSCSSWDTTVGNDLTTTSAPAVGQLYADYYKDHL